MRHSPQYIAEPFQYIVGIDEAGRGPIAGPVTVAAVALKMPFASSVFEGVKDSKKLSEKKRIEFRQHIETLREEETLFFSIQSTGAEVIDEKGIVYAISDALARALHDLSLNPDECVVKLDGALKAPQAFVHQETIIKGDEIELPITLASILAKTERDREMKLQSEKYPEYGFESHKGYGTKKHYKAIYDQGMCPLHRASFIHLTNNI